ncbi:MAG: toll/interleukin-1 receptor domain-containing protein [Gammaproteobacteria bacterium]|nr:toll/interleukin-1 receptor domain-containing protein [Gammaproteobacteria bacterium]
MPRAYTPSSTRPLSIHVLWHPETGDGPELARAVYRWFRGDERRLDEVGKGVPVFYRWQPASAEQPAPRPIHCQGDELCVVVPLIDEHMVIDPVWRRYLLEQIDRPGVHVYPAALHPSAFNMPGRFSRLNYLRLEQREDPSTWSWQEHQRARTERLLGQLTQAISRLLLARPRGRDGTDPGPAVRVFISHAKQDGTAIARQLREALLNYGQLEVFFDESELAFGYEFERALEDSARVAGQTAAMIVVYSDAYPTRPWCVRELRLAQTPRRMGETSPHDRVWRRKPMLVLDALEQTRTRFLPELGNAPVLRWDPGRARLIIDTLMREVLLYTFNELRALAQANDGTALHINCVPDLYALACIQRELDAGATRPGDAIDLRCPPPGPSNQEREHLAGLVPRIRVRALNEPEPGGG